MFKALITGITGQDGSYLAKFLLDKGYEVHGLRRRSSLPNLDRIKNMVKHKNFYLHYGDLTDSVSINRIVTNILPDEIYNLAAQSHVHVSFDAPLYTANTDALGTLRILECIKNLCSSKQIKFYQASTSEMYGNISNKALNEDTKFYPRSPYAAAKLYAYWITINYREAYDIFASNGILFNHESPFRGESFVTRKITRGIANILIGNEDTLKLGNLNAERDWGHAKDFVEAMWLIMQNNKPDDFVISTGVKYSIRDFIYKCFAHLGIEIDFKGSGLNEEGHISKIDFERLKENFDINLSKDFIGKKIIEVDPYYFRPTEVNSLLGDSSKAQKFLNWTPKTSFDDLIKEMIEEDVKNYFHG